MPKQHTIPLGYEIGTGSPVAVPLRHMAVTGQTQMSGKTTTLEALIDRAGGTALTFVTKRGEGSFTGGRRIQPYFRDRADWKFVDELLEAVLQEKNKFLRPWIMKICRNTDTLKEVQDLVRQELVTAKGINHGVFTQLEAYLDMVVPEIARADLAESLDLEPGLNVMDVSDFTTPMQMLFIQSALDWVNAKCRNTTVVIPEAWEFVPQGKGSPVKKSAETLVRKGGGLGNFIWLDSQDMAGVDKMVMRACTVWLIGVQREPNEIKRNLASIPAGMKRPNAEDIALLERGQFFACFDRTVAKVYVQPAWMTMSQACGIATGQTSIDDAGNQPPPASRSKPAPRPAAPKAAPAQEDEVDHATARALSEENARLTADMSAAEQRGYERGQEAALRQAGEFWNAAALDVRDHARKVADLADHLSGMAREGRWSLPRGAARPSDVGPSGSAHDPSQEAQRLLGARGSPKPIDDSAAETPGDAAPTPGARSMLDTLVMAHPLALEPREWALFTGKSPNTAKSGPWYKAVRSLVAAGWISPSGAGHCATDDGIAASGRSPARPKDGVELWALFRSAIAEIVGAPAMELLRVLAAHRRHRLSGEQWALLAGKSPASSKSGPWYSAVKNLREWDLIEGDGRFTVTPKGCAVIGDKLPPARADTAEALRKERYGRLAAGQRHYDALARPMTRGELAAALGVSTASAKSGPWYAAIKEMVESGLVADEAGILSRRTEELA